MHNMQKIGMIFPGFGVQFTGMGRELYGESRLVQDYFEEASVCLNMNFVKLCFSSSEAELKAPHNAYASIFLLEVAIAALIRQAGIKIGLVAGYGTGIYGALWMARSINFPDGLYMLRKLSQWYEEFLEKNNITMLCVTGIERTVLEELCAEYVAQHNDRQEAHSEQLNPEIIITDHRGYTLAGHRNAIEDIEEKLVSRGIGREHITEVPVEAGLYMQHSAPELRSQFVPYLEKVDFADLEIPCIDVRNGDVITTGLQARDLIAQHFSAEQRWDKILEQMAVCDVIIVPFPNKALCEQIKAVYPDKEITMITTLADVQGLIHKEE